MKIVPNPFATARHIPNSPHSHFAGTWKSLVFNVEDHFDKWKPGYRDGVRLVPVPVTGFFSPVVPLVEGMKLGAKFEARYPGEAPRLSVGALLPPNRDYETAKTPAVGVDIVLYSSAVLAKDRHNTLAPEDGNWEIVSVNARITVEDEPIHPDTLIANHLYVSGGTETKMTDEQFVAQLRISRAYWHRFITLL